MEVVVSYTCKEIELKFSVDFRRQLIILRVGINLTKTVFVNIHCLASFKVFSVLLGRPLDVDC